MNVRGMAGAQCALIALTLLTADLAAAKDPFILASGRRATAKSKAR